MCFLICGLLLSELLSQLSSVRSRAAAQSVSSQLQQLEMQLQSTRYPALLNPFSCYPPPDLKVEGGLSVKTRLRAEAAPPPPTFSLITQPILDLVL